ncbi:MAG: LysM peptidoglycan-binding domain-containing protein [Acidimicrobiales bacterium]|nr:LysM peptidoglycan-binding domain-containing protein [Acidimicrobiales bacterium]
MVAIQSLTAPEVTPRRHLAPVPDVDGRPTLVLLQGGLADEAARPSSEVYRRRRVAALVLVVALVVGAAVGVVAGLQVLGGSAGSGPLTAPAAATSAGAPALVEPSTIAPGATSLVVGPGDTLGGVARQITPAGGDVAATVDRLVARNGGVTSLQPGMQLQLD